MFASLNPGGTTHHYVPSKWHPYSVILRLIGPKLQKRLVPIVRPGSVETTGYPAFFDYCSKREMHRLTAETGFVDLDFQPYFRANDYFAFFIPFYIGVSLFENVCRRLNIDFFASGFVFSGMAPIVRDDQITSQEREKYTAPSRSISAD